jgi:hypothetical protein
MERSLNEGPDEMKIDMIREAFGRGVRFENITPDMQLAQWLVIGLKRLGEGRDLVPEDIAEIEKMGGTDHPDPYVTLDTLYG